MREQCSHCPPSRHSSCCSGAAVPAGAVGLVGRGEDFSLQDEDGLLGLVLNPYFCLYSLSLLFYKSPKVLWEGADVHGLEYPNFSTPAGVDSQLSVLNGGPAFLIRSA